MHRTLAWLAPLAFALGCSHTNHVAASSSAPNESRPGLGTVFGEERTSIAHRVPFYRDSAPPVVSSVYYNDRVGVVAAAAREPDAMPVLPLVLPGGLSASVLDEELQPLEAVAAGGRVWVVGHAGDRYVIHIANQTDRRFEIVASVDGLDVIDGGRANLAKRGYVVPPHDELTIDGFRRSQREVAAFRFGDVADSYAARTGSDRDVGVIGFAFFGERTDDDPDSEVDRRVSARPFL